MYRTHEMRKVRTQESGLEEWACPTCGRRMLLRWPPHYEKRVIEPGDEKACHVGSSPQDPGPPEELASAGQTEVMHMRNTRRWLRETGVDGRGRLGHLPLPPEPV
ncbi:hypothetical protein [Actinomadura sp. B10D3]|uniref:hypothetical protein n=1 Tax=Actinomadura sp. B10D3 TaxID=3153557 RepID=UPI00325F188E